MNNTKRNHTTPALTLLLTAAAVRAELNDTGISTCSDAAHNNLPCPVTGFAGQDAEYGTNGFNFTKLNTAGVEMPAVATDHTCVRDNVTGLIWEVKTDDGGLRDKDWTYTWNFATEPPGGHSGLANGGNCGNRGRCDTEKYVQDVNEVGLCGFRDWRVPSVKELTGIVDYGIYYGPSIFTNFFPNTRATWFWSSTPASYGSGSAWAVVFYRGQVSNNARVSRYAVRLVRGEPATGNFVDNGDGTVTDKATGLMWAKCSVGFEDQNCEIGRQHPLNWDEALDAARDSRLANYRDWRLPNVKELQSLVDYAVYEPSINTTYFPNTASRLYWSASPYAYAASRPSYSWPVNFRYGYVDVQDDDRTDQRAVRLVRNLQQAYNGQVVRNSQALVALPPTSATANQDWQFVKAPTGFANVIVLAGPPSYNNIDPGVVRLRNIGEQGFEMRFQEWEYRADDFLDTQHVAEDVPYLVLTRGRQQLPDGSTWEVGTVPVSRAGVWQKMPFIGVFNHPPHLFLTVQSVNDNRAVTARARNVGTDDFEVALFEEEALMNGHSSETVAYLAVQNSDASGLRSVRGSSKPSPYLLQDLVADQRWVPVLSQRIKVEEERSADDEVAHPDEMIDVLALGQQQLFAQQVSHNDADTTALRRLPPVGNLPMEWGLVRGMTHNWNFLPFVKTYANPVLVVSPVSMLGEGAGVMRLRNVTANYAELRYQEWDYLDGIHEVAESAFYMLVDAGQYVLGNPDAGLTLEAGRLDSDKLGRAEQWNTVEFQSEFVNPAVLAGVLTSNSSDDVNKVNNAVTTRITDRNATGFKIAMDEQESLMDGHTAETLGWIAIEAGALTFDGRKLNVWFSDVDSNVAYFDYPTVTQHRFPTVLGQVDSAVEMGPVTLQYISPTGEDVGLRLVEEQSSAEELEHVLESVGIFVGE